MDLPGSQPASSATCPAPPAHTPLVGFDIETDTERGGLDPETAPIVAVAVSSATGDKVFTGAEAHILRRTDERMAELGDGLLVTWNGATFDLPFVARRAEILGLSIGLELTDDPARRSRREPHRRAVRGRWHSLVHLDGYLLYRADVGRSLGLSCGLKPLARLVGMSPVELDRSRLHLATADEVIDYVASDARTAVDLVQRRMPAARTVADLPLPGPRPQDTETHQDGPALRDTEARGGPRAGR